MSTHIYLPHHCMQHNPIAGHPENPARIQAIADTLESDPIAGTSIIADEHPLPIDQTSLAHDRHYVDHLEKMSPQSGTYPIDADTHMDAYSLDAALLAAGTIEHAMQQVCSHAVTNAFCAVRPPGHHAEHNSGMGFCLFNSIALAALIALEQIGLERVAILDFDVHHGNGTEDIFRDDSRVLFCSSYQHPFYPHRNSASVKQRLVNVPLPIGTASDGFREAIQSRWWPELNTFAPQLILVSAGFDAHRDDPLAGLNLVSADYAWLGHEIAAHADQLCQGRMVAALEGGYHLSALASSTRAFCQAMTGA